MKTLAEMALPVEALLAQITGLVQVIDRAGRLLYVNDAWCEQLGYTSELAQDLHFMDDVLHGNSHEQFRQYRDNLTDSTEVSLILRRQDDELLHVQGSLLPHRVDDQLVALIGIFHDITPHHRQLLAAQSQLQAILANSGTVIGFKDIEGCYILVNDEFAANFGTDELLAKTDADLFPPDVVEMLADHDARVLKSNTALQFEETLPTIDGLHTFLSTKFPLIDDEGQTYAIGMIAKDITYRKLTEIQLLLRNQAIEYSPSGIAIADARLPDMPLIYVNPAFERTTGYSALDVIGKNCRFLQGDDRDQPELNIVRAAIKHEKSCKVVLRNYRKDGTLFYNELSLAPIHNEAGKLTHYVGISMNVTDRVVSDEKIQAQNQALVAANEQIREQNAALMAANRELATARRQAEEATRLKSQFLATMSHELRTPLNAIIGYTEIMLAGMTGAMNNEQTDYHERILTNADHLLDLINDVLDIAKIEAGRAEIINKPIDLRQWVDDVVSQTRILAEEKGLQFSVAVDERMPASIISDPARMRQVAINLLSNAVKFTEQGFINMRIRKHGRDAWKLIVEDSGIGIPSHMQETIFEEFRQVDSTSQRKAGGTGLGLSIVRKLTLMMGGNIRVKSQLGQGSSFEVILPLQTGGLEHD